MNFAAGRNPDPEQAAPPASLERCSVLSAAAEESAYGTAAQAVAWVAVEQPGPWGRDAVRDSHLDAELGLGLARAVSGIGGRLVLIRRPGNHADDHRLRPRQVLVAYGEPGQEWLLSGVVVDPASLRDLDLNALARGDQRTVQESLPALVAEPAPRLLICTNGRRDVCCAVRGRPVTEGVAATHPEQVWETSHTGGHRFAPTGVLLPSGVTLGRLSVDSARSALEAVAAGRFPDGLAGARHDRGRAALSPHAQVAESAVRHQLGEPGLLALHVLTGETMPAEGVERWTVRHSDGRRWEVSVRRRATGTERPVSCGRTPEPMQRYDVEIAAGRQAAATSPAP